MILAQPGAHSRYETGSGWSQQALHRSLERHELDRVDADLPAVAATCNETAERRTRAWRGADRAAGFTLIEMIVVLVIVGLALGLVITRGPVRSQRIDLDGSAREVMGTLRMARSRAIAQNRPVLWIGGPQGFRVDGDGGHRLASGVTLAESRPISFAGDGSSSGGRIVLRDGARDVVINVDWLTGRVGLAAAD
jgi:general secretion pathway protein H